jgi:hypothetical protein
MEAAEKIRLTTTIILLGFIFAFFYHGFIEYFYGGIYKNFLGGPLSNRFTDFYYMIDVTKGLNPYFSLKPELANYLPFTYLILIPLTWISADAAFVIFSAVFIYFLCWTLNYFLLRVKFAFHRFEYLQTILILAFLTYPVMFAMERANLDCLIFVLMALFLVNYLNRRHVLACILLSSVIAMKAYPAVFILLYLKERRFYSAAACILLPCLLTVIALSSFHAGFTHSLHRYQQIAEIYQGKQALYTDRMTLSSSLFQFVKMIYAYVARLHDFSLAAYLVTLKKILFIYEVVTVVAGIFIAWFFLRCEMVFWKQVMLLTLIMILFPPISGDYKLLFLFFPFLLFATSDVKEQHDYLYTILFGLLFIPKNYYILHHTIHYSVMDFMNVCIMLFFAGHIMKCTLLSASRKSTVGNIQLAVYN